MPKPGRTTGTGMTERTVFAFDPTKPADLNVLIAAANETLARTSFQRLAQRVTADAVRILAQANLPSDATGIYALNDDSSWRTGKGEFGFDTELGEDRLSLSVLVQSLGFAHDTPEGYAANALMLLHQAKLQLGVGSMDEAMASAFDLGTLVTEASMKEIFEPDFLRGEKVQAGGRKGHEAAYGTVAGKEAKWKTYTQAFDEEKAKGVPTMKAYANAAKRVGKKAIAIRRAVARRAAKRD